MCGCLVVFFLNRTLCLLGQGGGGGGGICVGFFWGGGGGTELDLSEKKQLLFKAGK